MNIIQNRKKSAIENKNYLKNNLIEFIEFLPNPTFIIDKQGIIIA